MISRRAGRVVFATIAAMLIPFSALAAAPALGPQPPRLRNRRHRHAVLKERGLEMLMSLRLKV
jgi:hypothetical protein